MNQALALLEFGSAAVGILAVDRMLKRSPVALLRCGTVHPGRFLVLVGGTVAATQEAHAEGGRVGAEHDALVDEILLPDPHPLLAAAVGGDRVPPQGEAVAVVEVSTCSGLLRALDAALKTAPVSLVELRLADDLGGRALAVLDGLLPDVQAALQIAAAGAGPCAQVLGATLLPRLDETLRGVLAQGTRFAACAAHEPAGAEQAGG